MKEYLMARYRKLFVAVAGLLALLGQEFLTPEHMQLAVEIIVALGTAVGVYAVPNEQA